MRGGLHAQGGRVLAEPADATEPRVGLVPRPSLTTLERPIPIGDDMDALRQILVGMVNASGLTQREISRRMGARVGNTINQFLMGRAMNKKPSLSWVSRLVFACGGRLWVEYPKR